ncbi:hypothetical protein D3C83_138740 [compost metagenome]
MVSTRNANPHGSAACGRPKTCSALPTAHAAAATASSTVWGARWRRTIARLAASSHHGASSISPAPAPPKPASSSSSAAPEAAGAP